MPRKDNSKNPLEIRIEAISVPRRMTPEKYLKALLKTAKTGAPLPRGLEVDIHWRNPKTKKGKTKHWREDDFQEALLESSAGFRGVVYQSILRQLRRDF